MARRARGPIACRWCDALATGTVTATGGGGKTETIPHCDACWERTYKEVARRPGRVWKLLDQPAGMF